jgi:tRNA(Ile)-lysidine synthase
VVPSLLIEVRNYLVRHALLPEAGVVVVAFSGGPDSLALLDILHQLTGPGTLYAHVRLHAAHLHHGLRGAAADEDAAFVATTCAAMGIPCTIEHLNGHALRRGGQSLEAALREARYAFLRRVAAATGAACIAVGHTADDQVETLIMHWLRGSGLEGASGMRPREHDLIRPLLGVTHAATRAYCAARGLHPREDVSNLDLHFLRNRIRHELLPVLRQYNPNLDATLLRSAAIFAEDYAFIEAAVTERWPEVVRHEAPHMLLLDARAYLALPIALRRHLMRRATALLVNGPSPLELRHHELIDDLARVETAGRVLTLPAGLWLQRGYGTLLLTAHPDLTHQRAYKQELPPPEGGQTDLPRREVQEVPLIPGTTRVISGTPWAIKAELLEDGSQLASGSQPSSSSLRTSNPAYAVPEPLALLDYDRLGPLLRVRARRPGDRFQPLGLATTKKLQDFMVDAHIPRWLRDILPLVIADNEIVWVAGYRISERARLTPATRRVLRLELLETTATQSADQPR